MALYLQRPWLKQGCCLWIAGANGAGKSIVGDAVGKCIGTAHYGHIQSPHDMEGEFTASYANKILLLVDEAKISSEKDYNNYKNLITGDTQRERMMHKNPKYRESFLNMIFAGNNLYESIPGLDPNARRFTMLYAMLLPLLRTPYIRAMYMHAMDMKVADVIDESVMEKWYFTMLYHTLYHNNNLGLRTLANFLYNIPVDNFEHRKISVTKLLMRNKESSMNPVHKWWMGIVRSENMAGDVKQEAQVWYDCITIPDLHSKWLSFAPEYQELKKANNKKTFSKENEFWDALAPVLPSNIQIKTKTINSGGKIRKERELYGLYHHACVQSFKEKYPGAQWTITEESAILDMDALRVDRVKGVSFQSYNYEFIPNPLNGVTFEVDQRTHLPKIPVHSSESWAMRLRDDEKDGYKVISTYSSHRLEEFNNRCRNFKPATHSDQNKDNPSNNNNNVPIII